MTTNSETKPEAFSGGYYSKYGDSPGVNLGYLYDRTLIAAVQQAVARIALLNPNLTQLTEYALQVNRAVQEYVDANPAAIEELEEPVKTEPTINTGSYL